MLLRVLTATLAVLASIGGAAALNNGLGRTPQMGWSAPPHILAPRTHTHTHSHTPPSPLTLPHPLVSASCVWWCRNSWNKFYCDIQEDLIRSTAETIVHSGLSAVGYNFINLDDCWQIDRNADGSIREDPSKFPSGIPALADHVHQLGLKFGLYSDSGQNTCQGRPGGMNYEKIDANTYAKWNVDYLKSHTHTAHTTHTHAQLQHRPAQLGS